MKKTLLVTAILSALVSATAGAATVYDNNGTTMKVGGRVEVRGVFSDENDATMKDASRARINFKGNTQISENLTGFAKLEYEIKNGSSTDVVDVAGNEDDVYNSLKTRYLFVGIGTQVGDFSYGRQDTAAVATSNFSDIASNHSGEQQIIDAASDKQDDTVLYSGTFADALTVQANYIFDQADDEMNAYGISAVYAFDSGVDFGLSYADQDDKDQATVALAYTWNALYLAATYAAGDKAVDSEFRSFELAAQYKATKALRFIAIYADAETDNVDTTNYVALEAQYRFNKSLRTYASYKNELIDDKEDELVVGLRYSF